MRLALLELLAERLANKAIGIRLKTHQHVGRVAYFGREPLRETERLRRVRSPREVSLMVPGTLTYEHLPVNRYRRLLVEVSEAISTHRDLTALFRDLARRLPAVVPFEYIALFLHDPVKNVMRIHMLGTADGDSIPPGTEVPVADSFSGLALTSQQPVIVPRAHDDLRFPISWGIRPSGVESFCMLPLTTIVRRLGAVGFGSTTPCAFERDELEFLQLVAAQLAVAVDNVLHDETARRVQHELERDRDRLRLLLEVNNAVVSNLGMDAVFAAVSKSLQRAIQHDGCSLLMYEAETRQYRCHVLRVAKNDSFVEEGRADATAKSPFCTAFSSRKPAVFGEQDLKDLAPESGIAQRLLVEGVKSFCCVPLLSHDRVLGTMNVGRLREDAFTPEDLELLCQVAQQVAIAVENGLAYQEIAELKEKLSKEKLYLEDEIRTEHNFDEIVGESVSLKQVLKQVEIVAPTDSTVLIQGETGTGKELIARAIHNLSSRRDRTFVKLNCAAIPTGLLESELFGHEKGAFTGAIAQKVGRFELAHGGTLFLDEVGEIPLELQSKFLRVLQEQEFERLGSNKTIRVDIRLVAATNRDLGEMVTGKEFRSDLFYRLNVFPIVSPPLRERREDVAPLVHHFARKFAARMKKRIETIPAETMVALSQYHWPGNIRELENFIERAVILSRGAELAVPLAELRQLARTTVVPVVAGTSASSTLEQAEREHIRRALEQTNWMVGGPAGAAAKLGMKRTTLQSRMAKLGLGRPAAQ
jgi:formate hydrogenlyase transcriptional activator